MKKKIFSFIHIWNNQIFEINIEINNNFVYWVSLHILFNICNGKLVNDRPKAAICIERKKET